MLEAIRKVNPKIKFYNAASSEMFGKVRETPQNEKTPFNPQSPYACAKVYGYWVTKNYRESYDMFACNGILFNHESPRRGETFVTRKIIKGVARKKKGLQDCIHLGNLYARRDWGHAKDYVKAMWLMLQQETPDDYVIATGKSYSVLDFLYKAFEVAGIASRDIENTDFIKIDSQYFRPSEVDELLGDSTKAREKLGWEPTIDLDGLIKDMFDEEMKND